MLCPYVYDTYYFISINHPLLLQQNISDIIIKTAGMVHYLEFQAQKNFGSLKGYSTLY